MSGGEEAVQATNDDATSCKISAVSLGYWRDNYIQFMTRLENICGFPKIFQQFAGSIGARDEHLRFTWATTPELQEFMR